jgi:adenylate cyclase
MKEDTGSTGHAESRRLAAIMFTDMVGFSRQMGEDEARMLRLLSVHNQTIRQAVTEHHGTVIKTVGDAFLVDFPSVVHAVQCAQQIQHQFRTHNAEKAKEEQIHVRIGIHSGDIVQRDGDVFGDGVNIASRLQGLAEPDTTCISDVVYRDVAKKLDLGTVVSLGKPKLKNIAEQFTVYALLPESPKGIRQTLGVHWLKASRRVRPAHRVVMGLMLLVGVITATWYFARSPLSPQSLALSPQAPLPMPDKPSIVVLPFVNMSEDPEQEYFSDGITEDLTSDLSKISGLFVIARNSAFTYKGKSVKAQDVSRELGVRYLLEGSVRKSDNQIRVTAQLIDATNGGHLWSERYDRPLKDVFGLQDEIVQKIVTTLKLQLTLMEQGILVRKTTENVEAYDCVLRGTESVLRAISETNKEANKQARQMFERAIELDPQYAEVYARLGATYFLDSFYQWNPGPRPLERAGELARQAIALNNSLPLPHLLLSNVYLWKNRQHEQAIAEAEHAIALDPNSADGYNTLGSMQMYAGRPEEAITLIEKAMRLNPRYPLGYLVNLGAAYRTVGRCEEAIAIFKKLAIRNPTHGPSHANLVICYAELGRLDEARAQAAEFVRVQPSFSVEDWQRRMPYKDPIVLDRIITAWRKAGLK